MAHFGIGGGATPARGSAPSYEYPAGGQFSGRRGLRPPMYQLRVPGSKPQEDLVLLEIANEQITNSEIEQESGLDVPEGRVAGDVRLDRAATMGWTM